MYTHTYIHTHIHMNIHAHMQMHLHKFQSFISYFQSFISYFCTLCCMLAHYGWSQAFDSHSIHTSMWPQQNKITDCYIPELKVHILRPLISCMGKHVTATRKFTGSMSCRCTYLGFLYLVCTLKPSINSHKWASHLAASANCKCTYLGLFYLVCIIKPSINNIIYCCIREL